MKIVKNIAIVGGGSSAWLTAAYLTHNSPHINITIIDKEIGTPIGVGEGTTQAFTRFINECGIDISELFNATDLTFKSGIMFPNWGSDGNTVWHPFHINSFLDNTRISLIDLWSKNQDLDFKSYGTLMYDTAIKNKIDRTELGSYAYHLDCGKLVLFLQKKLKDKVNFIKSDVVNVYRNKEIVFSLKLANGESISSDLYIDCTGFKNILGYCPDRVELGNRLFCNTAVAGHVKYLNTPVEMKPYTVSEAVDHGWIWTIPTQARMGTGLVFNNTITSEDEAKDCLVEYWQGRIAKENLKVLNWAPYYKRNFWEGNVVSIGLSSAFTEPLEATGLAFIGHNIVRLNRVIRSNMWDEGDVKLYNLDLESTFNEIVDFISMHYSKTERSGPFWKYVKDNYIPSSRIVAIEERLRESPRLSQHTFHSDMFSGSNWTCIMAQLGHTVGDSKISIDQINARKILTDYIENIENFRYDTATDNYTEIQKLSINFKRFN
jgi:tryptophan halogenase